MMDSQQHMRSTQRAPSSTVVDVNTIQLHLLDSRQHYKFEVNSTSVQLSSL